MAVSRGSLNSPDWRDLASNLEAYQEQNSIGITITLVGVPGRRMPDLLMRAQAWASKDVVPAAKPLASVSVRCSETSFKTVEAAIIYLLYRLDGLLASQELDGNPQ